MSTDFSPSPVINFKCFHKKHDVLKEQLCLLYVALNRKYYPEPQFPYLCYVWIIKASLSESTLHIKIKINAVISCSEYFCRSLQYK